MIKSECPVNSRGSSREIPNDWSVVEYAIDQRR